MFLVMYYILSSKNLSGIHVFYIPGNFGIKFRILDILLRSLLAANHSFQLSLSRWTCQVLSAEFKWSLWGSRISKILPSFNLCTCNRASHIGSDQSASFLFENREIDRWFIQSPVGCSLKGLTFCKMFLRVTSQMVFCNKPAGASDYQ